MFCSSNFLFQGTNSTGFDKDIVPRICAKPDDFYTIMQMKTITVRFASNEKDESSGAIAGYATYRESMFFFIVEQSSI